MRKQSMFFAHIVIGALLVTAVIGVTSLWVTAGARSASNKAASKVTEFYLQELAGRRSLMVADAIDEEFEHMRRALEIMEPADLASQDTLRSFLGKIETVYDNDLFALVDEDDVVYTQYATYSGGSRYDFLHDGSLENGQVISSTSLYGAGKQVCLAIPVSGVSFMGKRVKACFMRVYIESIVASLAFDDADAKTPLCLYYQNGENLTELSFGPIGANQNLFDTMHDNLSVAEWDKLSKDFYFDRQGGVEFTQAGVRQTLYYAPVPGTDWMLTVIVADELIQDQIRGVANEMASLSTIQIVVTGLALLAYFGSIIFRTRTTTALMLEMERQNTRAAGERAQKTERELGEVKQIAYKDALTGVKSKYAYTEREAELDEEIRAGSVTDFAVVVCDVNDLKYVNDTYGHGAGDEHIRSACRMICKLYAHSPVYRVGGDEFAVLLQGSDYARRVEILDELNQIVEQNIVLGEVVVAAGMADHEPSDDRLHETFHRADQRMYDRKAQLKAQQARARE